LNPENCIGNTKEPSGSPALETQAPLEHLSSTTTATVSPQLQQRQSPALTSSSPALAGRALAEL
jgi:hypothetical protein